MRDSGLPARRLGRVELLVAVPEGGEDPARVEGLETGGVLAHALRRGDVIGGRAHPAPLDACCAPTNDECTTTVRQQAHGRAVMTASK